MHLGSVKKIRRWEKKMMVCQEFGRKKEGSSKEMEVSLASVQFTVVENVSITKRGC